MTGSSPLCGCVDGSAPSRPPSWATAAEGPHRHARESLLAAHRALAQVRRGDPDPRVQKALARAARDAGAVRAALDTEFAARLAAAPETPAQLLAVETFLPALVAPLAKGNPVLLVVVDGMSVRLRGTCQAHLTDHRRGWNEVVRSADGAREAGSAAFTETFFSRANFAAALRPGTAAGERPAFRVPTDSGRPGVRCSSTSRGSGALTGTILGAELRAGRRSRGAAGRRGRPQRRRRFAEGGTAVTRSGMAIAGRVRTPAAARSRGVLRPHRGAHQRPRAHPRTRPASCGTDTSGGARWRAANLPCSGPTRRWSPTPALHPRAWANSRGHRGAALRARSARLPRGSLPRRGGDSAGRAAATGNRSTGRMDAARAGWSELVERRPDRSARPGCAA